MTPANRPPRDITPEKFFTEWLPREFATEFGPGKRSAQDITVAVRLEGEGGGHFILDVEGGRLRVRAPGQPGAQPVVTMRQPVADWRAVAVGEPGAVDLAPPHASPTDVLFVDPAGRMVLAGLKGTVRLEVIGYNERTWWMHVTFGSQAESEPPNATIAIDAETYGQLIARQMAPPEAYFSGKIALRGDTALAMQLAMSVVPRFTGQ